MRAFEADLGARVFDKVQGRYCLTEAGTEILGLAQTVAAAFEDIERSGSGTDRQLKGRIRLTAPASFSCLHLPALLDRFRRDYPDISVELLTSNEELNMSHRAAEIALRVTNTPPDHLIGRKLIEVPWGLYASPDYLKRKARPFDLADLSRHDLIGATGALARRDGFAMIDRDFRAQVVCRCDDLMTMAALAGQGLGLALLPADVAPPSLQRVYILGDVPANHVWLLTHPDLRKEFLEIDRYWPQPGACCGDHVVKSFAGRDHNVGSTRNKCLCQGDEENGLRGFDYEVAVEAFRRMGYTPTIRFLPWKRALNEAEAGTTAGILTCARNSDRERFIEFTDPISGYTDALFKRRGHAGPDIREIGDVIGQQVASMAGYASLRDLRDIGANPIEVPDTLAGLNMLRAQRFDYLYGGRETTEYLIKKNGLSEEFDFIPLDRENFHFCFAKAYPGTPKLVEAFNEALADMRADGAYEAIHGKYR
eukprot:g1275.t1